MSSNSFPSSNRFLIILHSHSYADRSYGEIEVKSIENFRSLCKFVYGSGPNSLNLLESKRNELKEECRIKRENILPMMKKPSAAQLEEVKIVENEMKNSIKKLEEDYEKLINEVINEEEEKTGMEILLNDLREISIKIGKVTSENEDDFCDNSPFNIIRSIIDLKFHSTYEFQFFLKNKNSSKRKYSHDSDEE